MKTRLGQFTLAIAAGAACALLIATLAGLGSSRSQSQEEHAMAESHADRTIVSVTGLGRVMSKPDRASVSIGVQHEAETAAEAQSKVSRDLESVIEAMRGLGVEGMLLTTSNLSLSPVYDYTDNRRGSRTQVLRGYRASNTLTVRIDEIDRLGEVLDAAILTGSNQVHGVSFELRDQHNAQLEALADATKRARERADAIAQALGREVERVLEVSEQGAQPSPILRQATRGLAMSREAMAAPTPIEPGELDTTARVTMTVRLSD